MKRQPIEAERARQRKVSRARITALVRLHFAGSIAAAAAALGVDRATLWRVVKGKTKSGASRALLAKLADYTGDTMDYFDGRGV